MESVIKSLKILPELSESVHRNHEFIVRVTLQNRCPHKLAKCRLSINEYDNCIPFVAGVNQFVVSDMDVGEGAVVDIAFTAEVSEAGVSSITIGFDAILENTRNGSILFGGDTAEVIRVAPKTCTDEKRVDFRVHTHDKNFISKSIDKLVKHLAK